MRDPRRALASAAVMRRSIIAVTAALAASVLRRTAGVGRRRVDVARARARVDDVCERQRAAVRGRHAPRDRHRRGSRRGGGRGAGRDGDVCGPLGCGGERRGGARRAICDQLSAPRRVSVSRGERVAIGRAPRRGGHDGTTVGVGAAPALRRAAGRAWRTAMWIRCRCCPGWAGASWPVPVLVAVPCRRRSTGAGPAGPVKREPGWCGILSRRRECAGARRGAGSRVGRWCWVASCCWRWCCSGALVRANASASVRQLVYSGGMRPERCGERVRRRAPRAAGRALLARPR